MVHPLIVDIKRHSLEDGPGIRSVVFFKGCPLRCVFCQNPETQDFGPQIVFRSRRCIDCGACVAACPQQASVSSPLPPIGTRRPQVDHPLPPGWGEGTALHVESCRGRGDSTLVTSASGSVEASPSPPNPHPPTRSSATSPAAAGEVIRPLPRPGEQQHPSLAPVSSRADGHPSRFPRLVGSATCTVCGACARACPSGALALIGQRLSVDEILDVVLRDEPFYRHSGGGVTLSGGECTVFAEFAGELLARLSSRGISAAIETCGEFSYSQFTRWILPHVNPILLDVKLANDQDHLRFTGRGNQRIWDNLARLLAVVPERVQPRIPLIPGITATHANLAALAARLARLGARSLTLLPYNPLGASMAESLGRPAPAWLPDTSAWAEQCGETIAWFKTEMERHSFEFLSA